MDEISVDVVLQMSDDELAEVLEEVAGVEFDDSQLPAMRALIRAAGSLEGAIDLLDEYSSGAEAA